MPPIAAQTASIHSRMSPGSRTQGELAHASCSAANASLRRSSSVSSAARSQSGLAACRMRP
eukprot:3317322-Prymnesium_polylepis.1